MSGMEVFASGALKYLVQTIKSRLAVLAGSIASNAAAVAAVEAKIPAQASEENQLADKSFVNSSVATNTANFIGTFDSVDALNAYSGSKTNNDYAFVQSKDAAGNTLFTRYKWNGTAWKYEYELNNSSFTAAQWAAVNSGVTAAMIPSGASSSDPLVKKSQAAMLDSDGGIKLAGGLDVAKDALFGQKAFFNSRQDMVIGHGAVPAAFADGFANRLLSGAYMAMGNDETGGIVVSGDGIDVWAPPDNNLMRFWNEDEGEPMCAISGEGMFLGIAESATMSTVRAHSSWNVFTNFINSLKGELITNSDAVSPKVEGRSSGAGGAGYYGFSRSDFVQGNDGEAPNATFSQWFVETKMVKMQGSGGEMGVQVAWGVASDGARSAYRRFYNNNSWGNWGSNDL